MSLRRLWKICLSYMFLECRHYIQIVRMLVDLDNFEVPTNNISLLYRPQCVMQGANNTEDALSLLGNDSRS